MERLLDLGDLEDIPLLDAQIFDLVELRCEANNASCSQRMLQLRLGDAKDERISPNSVPLVLAKSRPRTLNWMRVFGFARAATCEIGQIVLH